MKILHVLDHSIPLHSGYTFRTRAILNEQRRLGWETDHLTSPKQGAVPADEEQVDGLHFFRTRAAGSGWRKAPMLDQWAVVHDTRRRLCDVIPRVKPDLLHAHSPCLNGIAALGAARRFGLPVVYEVRAFWEDAAVDHGTTTEGSARYRLTRAMETWTLQRASAVTVICQGLRDDIVGRGIPADKVTIIPNAVNTAEFPLIERRDDELAARLGLQGAVVLGFLGSFYAYEGLDLLLEAMPQILATEPRARVLLVGGGPEEQRLKQQVSRLGIEQQVVFTGRVPHSEVTRYYSLVDLLVFPRKSMRLTETVTPLKPLEAMAQGCLLAASDVGGHRELIRDGETGYLFRPDDPQALAAAVARALGDKGRWAGIRVAGRRYVDQERNWPTSVARYREVYAHALGQPRHG
jgi:PEP-CTERM/exosortase A-associated glycosyltransferase